MVWHVPRTGRAGRLRVLTRLLARRCHLPVRDGATAPASAAVAEMPQASAGGGLVECAGTAVLDPVALQRLGDLDPTGANRLLERVLHAFDGSALRLLPQLAEAQRSGDHDAVRHVVHTLKSSSASIGALKLSQLCAEIEAMIRLQTLEGLALRIESMECETAAVLRALKQVPGVAW